MWTATKLATTYDSKPLSFLLEPVLNPEFLKKASRLVKTWKIDDLGLKKFKLNQKVLWCQFKAIIWMIFLLVSVIPSILICTYLWIIRDKDDLEKESDKSEEILITASDKKTILITGAPLTKALHIARAMGQAGHRIIIADQDWKNQQSSTKFSKYVDKFVHLSSDIPYEDALMEIWENEKIDVFLPVSHIHLAIEDTKAKSKMQAKAKELNRPFFDLGLKNIHNVEELDDKDVFLQKCQKLGLKVPDFKSFFGQDLIIELEKMRSEGKFNDRHYFLKPLELQRDERLDMTQIPSEKDQFDSYVNQHLKKKDFTVPYLLNEYIKGEEYAANVVCKNGNIYMFQVCPSSPIQTNYVSLDHEGIEEWVTEFVKETGLSGFVCFDFLVDKDNNVYCIECNPRLHSAIVSFDSQSKMSQLHQSLLSALNDENGNHSKKQMLKLVNKTEVYWVFQEIEKIFTAESSFSRFFDLIQNGKDAVWRVDDPIPFFIHNFVQIPWYLLVATINGTVWSKVNFCLGQVL